MTVAFGYTLKDYILEDEDIISNIKKSYKEISNKEEDTYYVDISDIKISPIFISVKKIGEIYHGVCLIVPSNIDIDYIKSKLHQIVSHKTNITEYDIWYNETEEEYKIYIECDEIIKNCINEYSDIDDENVQNTLYTLHKDK